MSKVLSCPNKALEVTVMFEPHRLQQTFLQAAYASLVPVSRKCLTLIQQSHPISWNGNRRLLAAEKGASHACIAGALVHVTEQASENKETYALIPTGAQDGGAWLSAASSNECLPPHDGPSSLFIHRGAATKGASIAVPQKVLHERRESGDQETDEKGETIAMTNSLLQLKTLEQSVWLDDIDHEHLLSGLFGRLIEGDDLSGAAGNPTIFEYAIDHGTAYDQQMRQLIAQGMSAQAIYETRR